MTRNSFGVDDTLPQPPSEEPSPLFGGHIALPLLVRAAIGAQKLDFTIPSVRSHFDSCTACRAAFFSAREDFSRVVVGVPADLKKTIRVEDTPTVFPDGEVADGFWALGRLVDRARQEISETANKAVVYRLAKDIASAIDHVVNGEDAETGLVLFAFGTHMGPIIDLAADELRKPLQWATEHLRVSQVIATNHDRIKPDHNPDWAASIVVCITDVNRNGQLRDELKRFAEANNAVRVITLSVIELLSDGEEAARADHGVYTATITQRLPISEYLETFPERRGRLFVYDRNLGDIESEATPDQRKSVDHASQARNQSRARERENAFRRLAYRSGAVFFDRSFGDRARRTLLGVDASQLLTGSAVTPEMCRRDPTLTSDVRRWRKTAAILLSRILSGRGSAVLLYDESIVVRGQPRDLAVARLLSRQLHQRAGIEAQVVGIGNRSTMMITDEQWHEIRDCDHLVLISSACRSAGKQAEFVRCVRRLRQREFANSPYQSSHSRSRVEKSDSGWVQRISLVSIIGRSNSIVDSEECDGNVRSFVLFPTQGLPTFGAKVLRQWLTQRYVQPMTRRLSQLRRFLSFDHFSTMQRGVEQMVSRWFPSRSRVAVAESVKQSESRKRLETTCVRDASIVVPHLLQRGWVKSELARCIELEVSSMNSKAMAIDLQCANASFEWMACGWRVWGSTFLNNSRYWNVIGLVIVCVPPELLVGIKQSLEMELLPFQVSFDGECISKDLHIAERNSRIRCLLQLIEARSLHETNCS